MLIRPATNDDAEAIRRVVFGVLAEYDLTAEHQGVDADLDDVVGHYAARGGLFEVIEEDGAVVGTVGLFPKGDGVCELRKMYLVPACRGRGWGRMLMDRMLDAARRLGFRRMELETSSKLIEANALYRRYGFAPLTDPHLSIRCDRAYARDL